MRINLNNLNEERQQNTPPENNSANGDESGNAESGSPSTDNDLKPSELLSIRFVTTFSCFILKIFVF